MDKAIWIKCFTVRVHRSFVYETICRLSGSTTTPLLSEQQFPCCCHILPSSVTTYKVTFPRHKPSLTTFPEPSLHLFTTSLSTYKSNIKNNHRDELITSNTKTIRASLTFNFFQGLYTRVSALVYSFLAVRQFAHISKAF